MSSATPDGADTHGDRSALVPLRAAVVGAGPAGFYATGELLKLGFQVDLYDLLPTPYGLVRSGVAPDHPKIKTVTRVFDKIAAHPDFRFFGAVELGRDISRADLLERYQAIVYAVGTAGDNRLWIPGEGLAGSRAATEFVSWYNGHPAGAGHQFDLTGERALVIGNGNVAIDIARMLVLAPGELARTDAADHAITQLEQSRIKEVVLVGRRGPAQAAFTTPELLELGELAHATVTVDASDMLLDEHSSAWLASEQASTTSKRNVEILRSYADRPAELTSHRITLSFLWSPVEILGDADGRVRAVRLERNTIEAGPDGRTFAIPSGTERTVECGLVIRSIGYRGTELPGIPFDEKSGRIRNRQGRVVDSAGATMPGEYTAGWIKRGPSGVIGTNKKCAADTVAKIREDRDKGRLRASVPDREQTTRWLAGRVAGLVTWTGWQNIDAHETSAGEPHGRPRKKLVDRDLMLTVATDRVRVAP
jgi:ferredoxin--NADP+ reductase